MFALLRRSAVLLACTACGAHPPAEASAPTSRAVPAAALAPAKASGAGACRGKGEPARVPFDPDVCATWSREPPPALRSRLGDYEIVSVGNIAEPITGHARITPERVWLDGES